VNACELGLRQPLRRSAQILRVPLRLRVRGTSF
jgi:hypothetical protein